MNAKLKNKSVLVLVRGLPGSGKSYFAEKLYKALIEENPTISLDPDQTDYESLEYKQHVTQQTKNGVDPKLHPYRFLRAKAYRAIREYKIAIWNQPFTNIEIFQKITARMHEHAQEQNVELSIIVVEVNIDPKIALKRIEERKKRGGHGPSQSVFSRFVADYESVSNLGYETIKLDGNNLTVDTINSVKKAIHSRYK